MSADNDVLPDDSLLPRDLRRSLPMALLRARDAVMSRFRHILVEHDISEQQWRVLRVLAEGGSLDATEVAERACLLAPSLTRIMRSLEERGFLTRQRDISDGRRVQLEISPSGMAMVRTVTLASTDAYAEIEIRFGKDRIELLLDMLADMLLLKSGRA